MYVALGAAVAALWAGLSVEPVARALGDLDGAALDFVARLRTDPATTVMRQVHRLSDPLAFQIAAWSTVAALVVLRRFQHLLAFMAVLLVVTAGDAAVARGLGRMRPAGVEILDSWDGYAHPSVPVAALAAVAIGAVYALAPAGRWRARAAVAAVPPVLVLGLARIYLAVDHPTDVLAALVTGMALPVVAFRFLTPDEAFPRGGHRGRRAHLDVGGRRGAAIVTALRDQLGLQVAGVEPFALSESAGSTPLRLRVDGKGDDGAAFLFGKLYATTHLRADRWYKLGRTVRYGRLEDERPFNTVRRLVEYEDHMLRLARDAGLPVARSRGFVEITPEREYVLVTEFLTGARGIDEAEIDDAVIDDALSIVRRLWDAGLAHRDIKPGNLLVRDGRVLLIDLAFAAVRPTPWRQAVDLANMLLTLALRSTPEHVYERALAQFTADELAEAFAASRSITIPLQLRAGLRADGRDLLGRFRALAPPRPPVSIQRWSVRRVGLSLAVLLTTLVALAAVVANLRLAGLL